MKDIKELEYDLAILGGGPAGLAAAIYAARGQLKTAIIDTGIIGGQLNNMMEIENYPGFPEASGIDLITKFEEHVDKFNVDKFILQEIVKVDLYPEIKTIETLEYKFKAKTVIIATGARPKEIGVPGEQEFIGRGVSYCAVCDGAFFKDKTVSVIGGGNSALEEAIYLTKFASTVNIIHRRDCLRADKLYQERALNNPKINFILNSVITEIKGHEKVETVILKDLNTDTSREVKTDGVFPYLGYSPNTELFKDQVQLDKAGFIITDESLATSCNGVYAAGDVRVTNLRQVVTSVADGAIASNNIIRYLQEVHPALA